MKEIFPDIKEKQKIKESPPKNVTFVFVVSGIEKKYRFEGKTSSGRYSLYNVETDFMTDMSPSYFNFWIDRKLKCLIEDEEKPIQKAEPIRVESTGITDEEGDEYYETILFMLRSAPEPDRIKDVIGKDPSELADEIEAASEEIPFNSQKFGKLMGKYLRISKFLTA